MPEVDYGALKKGGFMRQIQKDRFSMRLRVIGGQLTAAHLSVISGIAEKYGRGYVHLTSRQGVEIPFISLKDIDTVKKELDAGGVQIGACGPRVRTVTACQGSGICPSGLIETSELAKELDERYFGRELPHKFKIGITGCKNNCLKAEENDLGIKGGTFPAWQKTDCTFCGLCEAVCPGKTLKVDQKESVLSFDKGKCLCCGKCIKSCPVEAWEGKNGYFLSFGGMFGNEIKPGRGLLPLLFHKEQVFKAADAALEFYKAHGKPSERFGKTIARIGEAALKKQLEDALK
jgi:dissimilatory sulfite reductase (desulfoviridin) alpha/beta subunit